MSRRAQQLPLLLLPPLLVVMWRELQRVFAAWVARRRIAGFARLHLACGDHLLDDWANVDMHGPSRVIRWDLTRKLPIATGSMDFVYSEHFIEHIERRQAERLLRECRRVLKPGMRLWGHQFLFDAAELESLLREAGFSQMVPRPWRESPHAALNKLECRPFHGELIYDCSA